ncbi:MAG TPA: EndoU domain-containing protein [Jatrophihabitantaceae bacterium]|nr:EndoU domain-containing protein [Jatrophihabitantaceae bacterium]
MLRLLVILTLAVRFALHKKPPGPGPGPGPGTPGTPSGGKPPQRHGNVNAADGVSGAQSATADIAQRGRPAGADQPTPGQPPNQWDSVQGLPPRRENISTSPARRVHILDGDGDGVGGGHAPGTGLPNKTEFPEAWDDDVIIGRIEDVARNPDQPPIQQDNDRWLVRGTRDGVDIEVIVNPDGSIWTAYPTGGTGVVRNDEHGNPTP